MDQGQGQGLENQDIPSVEPDVPASPEGDGGASVAEAPARNGRGRKREPVRVESPDAATEEAPSAEGDALPALAPIADRVEAVLLSTERPLSPERVAISLGLIPEDIDVASASGAVANEAPTKGRAKKRPQSLVEQAIGRVDAAVVELNQAYEQTGRSFRIELVAGGYRVMTLSKYSPDVARLRNVKVTSKLSRAAIETLAIIAYKQPMTRAELEAIRGVSCGEVLKSLLERRLVTIKGRAEELGRPMLYGTTREFLDHFGLASIKDLPTVEELRASAGG